MGTSARQGTTDMDQQEQNAQVATAVLAALTGLDVMVRIQQRRLDGEAIQTALRQIDVPRRTSYADQFEESVAYRQVRRRLLTHAEDLHMDFPQYDGYWEDWKLGRMKRRVCMKNGTAIEEGDLVLVGLRAELQQLEGGAEFCCTVYNCRSGNNCSVDVNSVEVL